MSQTTSQPGMGKSSLTPGVSGESMHTPRGPKAWHEVGIEGLKRFGDSNKDHAAIRETDADDACYSSFTDDDLTQVKEESSLTP